MPPVRKQKRKDPKEQEEQERRIQAAIADVKDGKLSSVREAARKYTVPSTTLRNRMNGVTCRSHKWANSHRMTPEEEESLVKWTLSAIEQHQTAPSRSEIEEMANSILAKRGTTVTETVGESWVHNFLKRREELRTVYPRRSYSRRIYNTVVGNANASAGSPSVNLDCETGQPNNQQNTLPSPRRRTALPDLESLDNLQQLDTLISTFKELAADKDTRDPYTETVIDKLIKGCQLIVESSSSILKEARALRAALEEGR